ncbi:MAG: membrane protein insertase YidC [Lentimicrobiaceae bacterium]|jgi:YidC/Oxa1 family membrane protein insertase|nr:membrane protein insertase YidC [Lentimicrobiaceae bacterium]
MDKNTIIGFSLIALILIGYSFWMSPSKEELAERQRKTDSIAHVRETQRINDSIRIAQEREILEKERLQAVESSVDSFDQQTNYIAKREKYSVFANASEGESNVLTVENNVLRLMIDSKGGFPKQVELKDYYTWDSLPLLLFDANHTSFDLNFFAQNRNINTSEFYFKPYLNDRPFDGETLTLPEENDSLVFSMRLFTDDLAGNVNTDKYIEYQYIIKQNHYMIDFNINIIGLQDVIASNGFMTINWIADLQRQEKSVDRFNGSTIFYKNLNDDVDNLSESKDEQEIIKSRLKWISFKQRFFSSTIVAKDQFDNATVSTTTKKIVSNPRYLKTMKTDIGLPYQSSSESTIPLSFYFGPNSYYTLSTYNMDLERQVPLGWEFFLLAWINVYIVIPVFDLLGSYGWNYGIVILVLTILLKLILFPIAYKTYFSSAKMRVLKPEVDEINARYPKQEDAMKKQQAIMTLYKQAGASPMGGCLPVLLQMPILFAMFRFFPSSIELRQKSFLWATDLSSYDSILDLPFNIPFYGDHVSLFTLLMTISTIIYSKVNSQMMGQTNQMPGMKMIMYLMPVMFLGIFNSYAAGLSYYYLLANLITFAQMFVFRFAINEDKVRAQIEINKKKPIKKSNFQKRLEEAQKAQQRQLNQQKQSKKK